MIPFQSKIIPHTHNNTHRLSQDNENQFIVDKLQNIDEQYNQQFFKVRTNKKTVFDDLRKVKQIHHRSRRNTFRTSQTNNSVLYNQGNQSDVRQKGFQSSIKPQPQKMPTIDYGHTKSSRHNTWADSKESVGQDNGNSTNHLTQESSKTDIVQADVIIQKYNAAFHHKNDISSFDQGNMIKSQTNINEYRHHLQSGGNVPMNHRVSQKLSRENLKQGVLRNKLKTQGLKLRNSYNCQNNQSSTMSTNQFTQYQMASIQNSQDLQMTKDQEYVASNMKVQSSNYVFRENIIKDNSTSKNSREISPLIGKISKNLFAGSMPDITPTMTARQSLNSSKKQLQAFLTNKTKVTNVKNLDSMAEKLKSNDSGQIQQFQKEANKIKHMRESMKEKGLKNPQFQHLDLYSKMSTVKLDKGRTKSKFGQANSPKFFGMEPQRTQLLSQRNQRRPLINDQYQQQDDLLSNGMTRTFEPSIAKIEQDQTLGKQYTIQNSLISHGQFDHIIQESIDDTNLNFDDQYSQVSSLEEAEQIGAKANRSHIPNFLFSDKVEQEKAERVHVLVKNFEQIQNEAKYSLVTNHHKFDQSKSMSLQRFQTNYPPEFQKKNSQGVSLLNFDQSSQNMQSVYGTLSPIKFKRDGNHGPSKNFIDQVNQSHKKHLIEKRNRNRFLRQHIGYGGSSQKSVSPTARTFTTQNLNSPSKIPSPGRALSPQSPQSPNSPTSNLSPRSIDINDKEKATDLYNALQYEIKSQSKRNFTFNEFFNFLSQQRVRDKIDDFHLQFFKNQNSLEKEKHEQMRLEKRRQEKISNPFYKEQIDSTCKDMDNSIANRIQQGINREKEINGFISGFIDYLAKRDKHQVLRENVCKEKHKLAKDENSIFALTKTDLLVKIIDQFEKRDTQQTFDTSREINGLALRSDLKKNGDFIQFIEKLCQRGDTPDIDKNIARIFVNQIFEENMNKNRQILQENAGKVEFVIDKSKRDHADTPKVKLNLLENITGIQVKMTKGLAKILFSNDSKGKREVQSTLQKIILTFNSLEKGQKLQAIEQLKKDCESFGGIHLICDVMLLKIGLHKLFINYNIGELYKNSGSNLFEKPHTIKYLDQKKEAQNMLSRVSNVINMNLKPRIENVNKKYFQIQSDGSHSSSCSCDSGSILANSDKESSSSDSDGEEKDKKKHAPECPKIKKMTFKVNELNTQAISKYQAKQETTENALSYQNIFKEQIEQNQFYKNAKNSQAFKQLKKRNSSCDNENECNRELINEYVEKCESKHEIPMPLISKIVNNELKLKSIYIGHSQASALSQFLINAGQKKYEHFDVLKNHSIKSLCLDDNGLKDESFAEILKALLSQHSVEEISYMNNEFGPKSEKQLCKILNYEQSGMKIYSLRLSNLQNFNTKMIRQMSSELLYQNYMQQIELSHMNLEDPLIVENICDAIISQDCLYSLNISWGGLKAKSLCAIVKALLSRQDREKQKLDCEQLIVRQINFSYNNIKHTHKIANQPPNANKKKPAVEEKVEDTNYDEIFVKTLTQFVKKSLNLNHLDISGMGFETIKDRDIVLKLLSEVANSPTIQAVHLSDNYLRQDPNMFKKEAEFFNEVLNRFGIYKIDEFDIDFHQKQLRISQICKDIISNLDQTKLLKPQNGHPYFFDPMIYKDYIVKSMKNKVVSNQIKNSKQVIDVNLRIDQVVLTRQVNKQEFVCFDNGKDLEWKLSKGNECFVCDNHKQAVIFVDKVQENEGFVRIQDKDKVQKLKKEFNLHQDENALPVIFGTVTGSWSSPQKCIDSHLYSLISVIDNPKIQQNQHVANEIVQSVKSILNSDQQVIKSIMPLMYYLNEYQLPLHDKLLQNGQLDIMSVNLPDSVIHLSEKMRKFDKKRTYDSSQVPYVFCKVLPPGHHQFIVYIPSNDTFWFKDFILDSSKKISFPECPVKMLKHQQIVTDVWKSHKPTSIESVFLQDVKEGKTKEMISKMNKNLTKKEINTILDDLWQSFEIINQLFVEIISKSNSFPLADKDSIMAFFDSHESSEDEEVVQANKDVRAQAIDLILSQKKKDTKTLSRSQFMNFIMLIAYQQKVPSEVSVNEFICSMIQDKTQENLQIREQMLKNITLKKLLSDNKDGLQFIYKQVLENDRFTIESAIKIVDAIPQVPANEKESKARTLLCESQLSLQSDSALKYVEFLEFLTRLSMEINKDSKVYLRMKVHDVLESLYRQFDVHENIDEKLCGKCEMEEGDKIIKTLERFVNEDDNEFLIGLQILSQETNKHSEMNEDHKCISHNLYNT